MSFNSEVFSVYFLRHIGDGWEEKDGVEGGGGVESGFRSYEWHSCQPSVILLPSL